MTGVGNSEIADFRLFKQSRSPIDEGYHPGHPQRRLALQPARCSFVGALEKC